MVQDTKITVLVDPEDLGAAAEILAVERAALEMREATLHQKDQTEAQVVLVAELTE